MHGNLNIRESCDEIIIMVNRNFDFFFSLKKGDTRPVMDMEIKWFMLSSVNFISSVFLRMKAYSPGNMYNLFVLD